MPNPKTNFSWTNFPSTIDSCTSPTLNWDYSGPQETLLIFLASTVSGISKEGTSVTVNGTTLAIDVDAAAASWTWSKVNFTAGQYIVGAAGTNIVIVPSPKFMIANGADSSCLATAVNISSVTLSVTSTTPYPEPSVTPMATASVRRAANAGVVAGGTVAGAVILMVALLGYRVWAWRHEQRLTRSRYPTEATHGELDLPSLYIASGIQAPPLTEKGAGSAHPLDNIVAVNPPPLIPNRRPPSSLLSEPHTPVPPYTSHAQARERESASLRMDVSTIGSRSSALSDATSTAGLMGTFSSSSCPPSYATRPSLPPSYATDITRGATTPRSAHLSYASSS